MKKPTRRDALLATAAIGAVAASRAKTQTALALESAPMSDVIRALASGQITPTALTKGYLARIEAYDRDGPKLKARCCGRALPRQALGPKAAGRYADPGEGQHCHRRQTANHGRFAGAGGRARQGRRPLSRTKGNPATPPIVFLYELKRDLNLYLKDWATNTRIKTVADIVAFNETNAEKALRFGQDLFLAANLTKDDLSELEYRSARAMDLLAAKTHGMDTYMNQHKLDAVLFPGSTGAAIAVKAGYPSVMVLGGFISGSSAAKDTPDYPFGVTFAGLAWSEHKLLRLAYAYEQVSDMRKPPPGLLAL